MTNAVNKVVSPQNAVLGHWNGSAITACTTRAPTATALLAAANISVALAAEANVDQKISKITVKASSSSFTAPTASQLVQVWHISNDFGFPSAHTVHGVLFYGFLLYLASTHWPFHRTRRYVQGLLVLLMLVTGPSRVYLGAHWPSDVLGGYLLGGLLLAVMLTAYRRWRQTLRYRSG